MTDSEQNSPSPEVAPDSNQTVTKKKRSPVERAIVWGLISVFLIVILLEWNARYGYSNTLAAMQDRIGQAEKNNGKEFSLVEAKQMVKGFPYGDERLTSSGKQLQYRWFSLFRTFAIQLSVGVDNQVLSLETDVEPLGKENAQANSPKRSFQKPVLPETGLSKEYENVVVLTSDQLNSQAYGIKGILFREVVRQALLIGGRDGLGLKTRDASLRGEVQLIENPETFPLKMMANIDSRREVNIELERPHTVKAPFHWYSKPFVLPKESAFETLIEKSEELSRSGFVDALKSAGYTGDAPQWLEESTIPDKSLQQLKEWNFISQYTVIQDMHSAIATEGESPERLAVLTRAYANLGSLTEYLWSPAHKVFKARALLYAERLTARTEDSPWALAHRAYARAFAGIHRSALADIETIRTAASENAENKRPLPDWLELIDAYCSYQPDVLDKAVENENTRHLAIYLRCLLADPVGNEKQMLAQTEQLLDLEPACCRAMDRLCEVNSLGILRRVTEQRLDQLWPVLHQKLLESNLRKPLQITIQMYLGSKDGLITEQQTRVKVIDFLKKSELTDLEPSLNGLGQLLQEVSFSHVYRKLKVLTGSLSLKADDVLPEYRPLVKGHPYEQYIESFTSNQVDAKAAYEKLLESHNPHELDFTEFPMILHSSYKLNADAYSRLYLAAAANTDNIYEDQLQRIRCLKQLVSETREDQNRTFAETLLKVSPHMPQTVAMNIDTNKEYAETHQTELLEKYGKNPIVLTALANKYLAEHDEAKAEETLQRRIAIVPDHRSYTSLAELYYKRGETEKWKETLEKALELPSLGLQNANIESKLAYYHMDRGEWELAKPHAVKAAMTYSGWGLLCGAKCYEGLGDLQQAEVFVRACSMRYEPNAANWYFWCVRTDFGDIESARRLAEQRLLANPTTSNLPQTMELGVFQLTQGLKSEAFDTFSTAFQKHKDTFCGLHAALLADELELTSQRDDLLAQVSALWSNYFGTAELANYFQRMLLKPEAVEWNAIWFQTLLAQVQEGNPTNFYYFAGKFLEQQGQDKWATVYLQSAASSSATNKYNCVLAAQHLRSQNKKVNPRRTRELEAGYDEAKLLAKKAGYLIQAGKREEAIQIFNKILKLKPDLVSILINRGQMHEALKNYPAAIADYKKAIEIDAEYWLPHNNLAFLYAANEQDKFRDGAQALEHAQKSFDLLPTKYWVNYNALAVAHAETGQFEKAIELQNQALQIMPESDRIEAARRLKLFKAGKPYRRSAEKK
ncbi:tetratricopeptide repeat protein [uncultured Gimesia sp.]|uniref:tetratricopeptide repeat protein n=1 Tax=uncultured Gimesia sp. TaxID=1678688 RepID=UPI0030D78CC5|tara:strand:+ start:25953 stop:29729 length:3777 start_codon:yes stop_codon:yes gene_type:complete